MESSLFAKLLASFKKLLIYQPDERPERFVLAETATDRRTAPTAIAEAAGELAALLRYARRLEATLAETAKALTEKAGPEKLGELAAKAAALGREKAELAPILLAYANGGDPEDRNVSASLAENIAVIERLYNLPANSDVTIRRLTLPSTPPTAAALVFAKVLISKDNVNSSVLLPLLTAKGIAPGPAVLEDIAGRHLPINCAVPVGSFREVVAAVSGGDSVLFADGAAGALAIETEGYEHRPISRPAVEQTVRGNQSAFTDTLRINVGMVKILLRSPDLVADLVPVGKRGRLHCAVMYLKSVANPRLVAEVKRRLGGIATDYVAPGTLEQFIEDHPGIPLPQTLSTEKPERVTAHLAEGRVAILLDGDPFALVVPVSVFALLHSPEDFALKPPSGTFMRLLRLTAVTLAMLLPSMYIALTYYHPEAIPTDLLLAIAGARERIPFPAFFEVLVMEASLEFTREAGTRVPGMLGETIGIVGGIILGQAVVAANLISPVTVVVVAITAVASFATPDYRVGMTVRQARFVFLVAAALLGLLGVAGVLFLGTVTVCSMKSFGMPLLASKTLAGRDALKAGAAFGQERRPDELNARDRRRQPEISREWDKKPPEGGPADEL